jgi:O-methyltransferase
MLKSILDSYPTLRLLEVLGKRQENRISEFGMLAQAFDFIKTNGISGDYFEFGLWRGKTFGWARLMAQRYGIKGVRFRGFDSFQGLPKPSETEHNIWSQGQFACSRREFEQLLEKKGFRPVEYELTEGFYDQTLTEELSSRLQSQGVKASLVYIDCDLYESARQALWFMRPFLQDGTILCFDDWFAYRGRSDMGEQRAFGEFQKTFPDVQTQPYVLYGSVGMSFLSYSQSARNVS